MEYEIINKGDKVPASQFRRIRLIEDSAGDPCVQVWDNNDNWETVAHFSDAGEFVVWESPLETVSLEMRTS